MSSLSPLQISAARFNEIFGSKVLVEQDQTSFGFLFNPTEGNNPPYEALFVWKKASLVIEYGVALHFDLAPLRNKERVCAMLRTSVHPFLSGLYEGLGSLVLRSECGAIVPVYEVHIDYGPLEDEEISPAVERSLVRAVRTLTLLTPILECIEQGCVPNREEQARFLMLGHAIWEVNSIATDVPTHGVRFPPGLFGGVRVPLAQ